MSGDGGARQLALVVHFHQPVGNLDEVVRNATDRCYRPFLETLDDHPDIRMTLHYSGCLLEWLEANAPDVPRALRNMVERGQVELMTGGFYEPVLAALPHVDRAGQIEMLSKHLRQEYLAEPRGLWLTERVWEQDVVPALIDAGVAYTVVDDTMFHAVGISDDELTGAYVTEYDGRPLLVYAGDRRLRYLIPYKKVARVFDHIEGGEPERLFVYADDGEKFGEWPDTHERVYGKGWLGEFFERLGAHDGIELTTLGEHSQTVVPTGRVYLPSSSYDEMMTWALPADARLRLGRVRRELQEEDPSGALPFLRGAPWRSFLAKYPEVNQLQKRMLHVSKEVHASADPPEDALRELYRAQCNCAYWHGAFGGVYLTFMRGALWHHLMRAEGMVSATAAPGPRVRRVDLDADALDEVIVTAPWGVALFAPHRGGSMIELDDWQVGANVLAVVARHREAYHVDEENPPEEPDEDEMGALQARAEIDRESLIFDDYGRGALVDYVDGERVAQPFDFEIDRGGALRMWIESDGLMIEKRASADADELLTTYTVTNTSASPIARRFASEASVMPLILGRDVKDEEVEIHPTGWTVGHADAEVALSVEISEAAAISIDNLATASATLEGLQEMHQGTEVRMEWPLELGPGDSLAVDLRWRVVPNERALTKKERGVSAAL